MFKRVTMTSIIALTAAMSVASWAQTRGEVADEEKAAGIRQTPQQRKVEGRELQNLYKTLLDQERSSSPTQPGMSR